LFLFAVWKGNATFVRRFGVSHVHYSQRMKFRHLLYAALLGAVLVSCSDYQKLLKSTDFEVKWQKANEYYEKGQYARVIELLEELQAVHKGTERSERTLFMLADAYLNIKDYYSAENYFDSYYRTFPKGVYAEEARFLCGKAAYLNSPDARLTQDETGKAIQILLVFLDYFPESKRVDEVNKMLEELTDKLVYKQLLNSRLYFNLGNYLGDNNYQSCIVTANNALMDYPVSKYREELAFLVLKSRYVLATQSVQDMLMDRYRAAIDEYYSFINEFPESKYKKEADNMLKESRKIIKE
jgi:outer membrane protein assembly factor BamD